VSKRGRLLPGTPLTDGRRFFLVFPWFSLLEAPPFQVLLELLAHSGRENERLERGLVVLAVDGFAIFIKTEARGQFRRLFYDRQWFLLGYTCSKAYNIVELSKMTVLDHSVCLVQHKELDGFDLAS